MLLAIWNLDFMPCSMQTYKSIDLINFCLPLGGTFNSVYALLQYLFMRSFSSNATKFAFYAKERWCYNSIKNVVTESHAIISKWYSNRILYP